MKKLAMFLAVIMMFSSLAVVASAAEANVSGGSIKVIDAANAEVDLQDFYGDIATIGTWPTGGTGWNLAEGAGSFGLKYSLGASVSTPVPKRKGAVEAAATEDGTYYTFTNPDGSETKYRRGPSEQLVVYDELGIDYLIEIPAGAHKINLNLTNGEAQPIGHVKLIEAKLQDGWSVKVGVTGGLTGRNLKRAATATPSANELIPYTLAGDNTDKGPFDINYGVLYIGREHTVTLTLGTFPSGLISDLYYDVITFTVAYENVAPTSPLYVAP